MTNLTDSIHTYLTAAPASGFAGQRVTVLDHWHGDEHLLWRAHAGDVEAVVKLFLDAGQARGRRQFDGQARFAPAGIAPQPLWFDRYPEGLARQVLTYRWVEGRALNPATPHDLAALAASVAHIHSAAATEVRRISPRAVNLAYFWRVVAGSIALAQHWLTANGCPHLAALLHDLEKAADACVATALPSWQHTPPTPIHGDLKLQNLLIVDDRALLLDWEMFGLGDPALEVATLLADSADTIGPPACARWLRDYLDAVNLPKYAALIDVYTQLLPLQRFTFLLDGLRQLTPAERRTTDFRDNRVFLIQTISTAGQRAATALGASVSDDGLRPEIERLTLDKGELP